MRSACNGSSTLERAQTTLVPMRDGRSPEAPFPSLWPKPQPGQTRRYRSPNRYQDDRFVGSARIIRELHQAAHLDATFVQPGCKYCTGSYPTRMNRVPDLGDKLDMLLKASSLSRVSIAHEVGVDKSLVGRWVKGAIHPGEHNLAKLTGVFRSHFPQLTVADWYEDKAELARRLGIHVRSGGLGSLVTAADGPFAKIADVAEAEIAFKAATYEGFWRTTRPSVVMQGELFHDYGIFRLNGNGMIDVIMEGAGLTFSGWMFPMSGNLYVFLFDPVGRTPLIVLMKGVTLPRALSMEGLLLLSALDPLRTPAAVPIVLERLGDLSGDKQADDRRLREIIESPPEPVSPLGQAALAKACFRDVGPAATQLGGSFHLVVTGALSQGATSNGLHG